MNQWLQQTNIRGPQGETGPGIVPKGTVPTEGDLPPGAAPGDMYTDDATGHMWVWDGSAWVDVGATRGADGLPGPSNALSIGTVTTGAPGSAASASISGTPPVQVLSLGIPRGDVGAQGSQGVKGDTGNTGSQGPKGDAGNTGATGSTGAPGPANSLAIGTVTTVAPGGAATSTITGTPPSQTLNLGIPRGDVGAQGIQGIQGPAGADGAGSPATVLPLMDGAAAVGTTTKFAREDHKHPSDTAKLDVAAATPPATVTPLMDGTGAVGTVAKYAKEDHRHPTDTSRAASTHTHAQADVTNLTSDLALKAPLAAPVFTGDARAVTPTAGDNDTSIATTAFVTTAVAAKVATANVSGSAPGSPVTGQIWWDSTKKTLSIWSGTVWEPVQATWA